MKHHPWIVAIGLVLCALLVGCGDDDTTGASALDANYVLTEMTFEGHKTVPPEAAGVLTLVDTEYTLWMTTPAYSSAESGTIAITDTAITLTSRSGYASAGTLSNGNTTVTVKTEYVLAVFVKN